MKRYVCKIAFNKYSVLCGLFFSIFLVFGYQLKTASNIIFSSPWTYFALLPITAVCAFCIGVLWHIISSLSISRRKTGMKPIWFYFLTVFAFLLFWIPSFLGLYPGLFVYDALGQWLMVANQSVTTHHPVIHTVILGNIIQKIYELTGAFNKGVCAYTLFQLLVSSLCFSYILTYIYRKGLPRLILGLSFVWFTAFPVVILNLFAATKDSIFSALLLVFLTMTLEITENPDILRKPYFLFSWILITFLTSILRNNAIYVTLIFAVIFLCILRSHKKILLPAYAGIGILYLLYSVFFCSHIVTEDNNTKEFLSVPLQQLMRVYSEKQMDLSSDDNDKIEALFDTAAIVLYNPRISDAVKNNTDMELLQNNKKEYLSLWWRLLKKYPAIYLNSFAENTYGFWYPKASLILSADGTEGFYSCSSVYPASNHSLLPFIYDYYLLFSDSSLVQGDSWTVALFSPGTFFFLFLFTFFYCLKSRNQGTTVVLLYVLLLWLTFLLGPAALVRYVAFLYYMIPLEVTILLLHHK